MKTNVFPTATSLAQTANHIRWKVVAAQIPPTPLCLALAASVRKGGRGGISSDSVKTFMQGSITLKTNLVAALGLAVGLGMLLGAACASGGPKHVEVSVQLVETGMTPKVVQAKQGDMVMLKFQAHQPGEVHLHGYDIEKEVTAGAVTELEFTADATGRFKITFHAGGVGHEPPPGATPVPAAVEEEKAVGYLEVLPR